MAGYSGTPLTRKLGIGEGATVALLDLPAALEPELGTVSVLPSGVRVRRRAGGTADVVVAFVTAAARLERRIGPLGSMVFPAGGLWIAWPKRASSLVTDLTDHVVREVALPRGLVDNKVCAVDDDWTALRLVWRVEHRGGTAPLDPVR